MLHMNISESCIKTKNDQSIQNRYESDSFIQTNFTFFYKRPPTITSWHVTGSSVIFRESDSLHDLGHVQTFSSNHSVVLQTLFTSKHYI